MINFINSKETFDTQFFLPTIFVINKVLCTTQLLMMSKVTLTRFSITIGIELFCYFTVLCFHYGVSCFYVNLLTLSCEVLMNVICHVIQYGIVNNLMKFIALKTCCIYDQSLSKPNCKTKPCKVG